MNKKIISTLGAGVMVLSLTGCVGEILQTALNNTGGAAGDLAKQSLQSSTDSADVQASDGTTNTGATVTEGAGVGAVAGAVVGKQLGLGSGLGAAIGGFLGGVAGKAVDDNNKEQAEAEKKVADETADYDAKTAELKDKIK